MSSKQTDENKLKMLFGNAVSVSDMIKNSEEKNPRSISKKMLETYIAPDERKDLMTDIESGICFGCGGTESNYACSNCMSIMFCRNCQSSVLKKHAGKCSGLIVEENRNRSINAKVTQIVFQEQFKMSYVYISARNDFLKQRKIFTMYTNYYFSQWAIPADSEEDIALMASMAGLVSTTLKIAKMSLDDDNFKLYLKYINEGGVCFSCCEPCKKRCSRCRVTMCKACQTDKTHRGLCKTLSL